MSSYTSNSKPLIILLISAVCVSLFFLGMGKNKTLGRKFFPVDERDPLFSPGDLYMLSRIDAFKERIAETQLQERLSTENVDLLIMGDSFLIRVLIPTGAQRPRKNIRHKSILPVDV